MKKINLISLPFSHDRRQFMINQFSQHGWDYNVLDAVNGDNRDAIAHMEVDWKAYSKYCGGREIHPSDYRQVGCYASHLSAYEYILSTEKDYGLICEDDVEIFYGPEYTEILLSSLGTTWDALYLCEHVMPGMTELSNEYGPFWTRLNKAVVGVQLYAMSLRLAEFILENRRVVTMPIDDMLRSLDAKKFRFITLDHESMVGRHYSGVDPKLKKSIINHWYHSQSGVANVS